MERFANSRPWMLSITPTVQSVRLSERRVPLAAPMALGPLRVLAGSQMFILLTLFQEIQSHPRELPTMGPKELQWTPEETCMWRILSTTPSAMLPRLARTGSLAPGRGWPVLPREVKMRRATRHDLTTRPR